MDARLIVDSRAAGSWNMAVDEALFQTAQRTRQVTIRFYQWEEPTLSLGYFQAIRDRENHAASQNCPLVRRSTGGGAIVHDRELTYSLMTPLSSDRSNEASMYVRRIHESLVEILAERGARARFADESSFRTGSANESADGLPRGKTDAHRPAVSGVTHAPIPEPFLCFQRRAPDDVVMEGHKVAGSAQRKLHQTLLQHGSVLLGRSKAAPELPGINDILPLNWTVEELLGVWRERLASDWIVRGNQPEKLVKCNFHLGSLTEAERDLAREFVRERFGTAGWNAKR